MKRKKPAWIEDFRKDVTLFPYKVQQSFYQFVTHIENRGWTFEQAREYFRWVRREERRKYRVFKKLTWECPDCGGGMFIYEVNHHPSAMVGGDSKSMLHCRRCDYAKYSPEVPRKIVLKKLSF